FRTYVRDSDASALRTQLGDGAPELTQIVPELRAHFPDLPEPRAVESEGARFRLFDAAAEFLDRASQARPILLALHDLHARRTPRRFSCCRSSSASSLPCVSSSSGHTGTSTRSWGSRSPRCWRRSFVSPPPVASRSLG